MNLWCKIKKLQWVFRGIYVEHFSFLVLCLLWLGTLLWALNNCNYPIWGTDTHCMLDWITFLLWQNITLMSHQRSCCIIVSEQYNDTFLNLWIFEYWIMYFVIRWMHFFSQICSSKCLWPNRFLTVLCSVVTWRHEDTNFVIITVYAAQCALFITRLL